MAGEFLSSPLHPRGSGVLGSAGQLHSDGSITAGPGDARGVHDLLVQARLATAAAQDEGEVAASFGTQVPTVEPATAVHHEHARGDVDGRHGDIDHRGNTGNTPASAGRTRRCGGTLRHWSEHPRIGGEDVDDVAAGPGLLGTPPRVRGAVGGGVHRFGERGPIPAGAGSSWGTTPDSGWRWDHPRG